MSRIDGFNLRPAAARVRLSGLIAASLAALLCGAPGPARAEIDPWTDAQDTARFSDRAPSQESARQATARSGQGASAASLRPAAARRDSAPARSAAKPVVMYSVAWCGYCKLARSYFDSHAVPYRDYDVEKDAAAGREFQRLRGGAVPLILIGGARLDGFTVSRFERLYRR